MVASVDVADSMGKLVATTEKLPFDFYSETRSRSVNAQFLASPSGVLTGFSLGVIDSPSDFRLHS